MFDDDNPLNNATCKNCGSGNLHFRKQEYISIWGILFIIFCGFPFTLIVYAIYCVFCPNRIDAVCNECGHVTKGVDHQYV